jgi:hypothetical protein
MKPRAACLLTLLLVISAGEAGACEPEKATLDTAGLDLGWIQSSLGLYGVGDGELYEARLGSKDRTVLARLPSKSNHGLAISPDGRYLLYDIGTGEEDSFREFHLFDLTRRVDRVVPVLPQPGYEWEVEFLGFSPDSKSLAWLDDDGYTVPGTEFTRPELVMISTQDLARRELPYPAPNSKPDATSSCFTPQWGADGKSMLVNFTVGACLHLAKDERTLSYSRIDLGSGESRDVDGGYSFDPDDYFFRSFYAEDGKRIERRYACLYSHACGVYSRVLESGTSRAWMQHVNQGETSNGPEELFVQTADAPPRKIATGFSSFCAGTDIQLIAWVENGKCLLYEHEGNTYLFAPAESRAVPLPQLKGDVNWLPLATTDRLYFTATSGNGDEERYGPASAGQ